jgi:5-methylcytosine-specific restriction endonuclease McrA
MADLIGKVFGKLTVLESAGKIGADNAWKCICECGNFKTTISATLNRGNAQSCGCLALQARSKSGKANAKLDPKLGTAKNVYIKKYNDGDLTFDDFLNLSQFNCNYCGKPPANKTNRYYNKQYTKERMQDGYFVYNGLDRINSKLLHTLDNVVTSCKRCNQAKNNMELGDFLNHLKKIHSYRVIKWNN